jgi:hypothetical protein
MADKLTITCGRCRNQFREWISRIRDGLQRECPNCGCFINFINESPDPNIARVMREARRLRNGFLAAPPGEGP